MGSIMWIEPIETLLLSCWVLACGAKSVDEGIDLLTHLF